MTGRQQPDRNSCGKENRMLYCSCDNIQGKTHNPGYQEASVTAARGLF